MRFGTDRFWELDLWWRGLGGWGGCFAWWAWRLGWLGRLFEMRSMCSGLPRLSRWTGARGLRFDLCSSGVIGSLGAAQLMG